MPWAQLHHQHGRWAQQLWRRARLQHWHQRAQRWASLHRKTSRPASKPLLTFVSTQTCAGELHATGHPETTGKQDFVRHDEHGDAPAGAEAAAGAGGRPALAPLSPPAAPLPAVEASPSAYCPRVGVTSGPTGSLASEGGAVVSAPGAAADAAAGASLAAGAAGACCSGCEPAAAVAVAPAAGLPDARASGAWVGRSGLTAGGRGAAEADGNSPPSTGGTIAACDLGGWLVPAGGCGSGAWLDAWLAGV